MLHKFTDACELILEDNKSDMKSLKSEMMNKFNLKSNNFSDISVLPNGIARMRVVAPNDKQFIDDVFFVDIKQGKYEINSLTQQDLKADDMEELFNVITPAEGEAPEEEPEQEPEGEEPEKEEEPEADTEEEPEPEKEEEPEEKPEDDKEKEKPSEDEFEDSEKKKEKKEKEEKKEDDEDE